MVGAVVLMAIAIILIPEMLSGPRKRSESVASATVASAKLKTYTIDLAHSNASTPPAAEIEQRLPVAEPMPDKSKGEQPPPESDSTDHPPDQLDRTATSKDTRDTSEPELPKPVESSKHDVPSPKTESPAVTKSVSQPSKHAAAPSRSGWTVQAGSFSKRATAEELADALKRAGLPAFTLVFESGSQTLYRVRVGPVADRVAAESLLQKVKQRQPGAAIVPP